ncbi:MAG: DUF488 domain-containing protein [Patescibacteria group bacterium]|nr:DUF488 domain-containing protein [Patescibacteria group bacterium]
MIFTLGTSNRHLDEFLGILNCYQIKLVVDVRRWPTSKWFEYFKKENLKKILSENNIEYLHFEKLGGYRSGGYEEYTKTKEFRQALEELVKILKNRKTVIICAEKLPWKCHRAYIGRELEKKGIEVIHIIEKDCLWLPRKEPKQIKPFCQKLWEKKVKKDANLKLDKKENAGQK